MTKIWCLFSIENNYEQPEHNLVCWWSSKPKFETILRIIGGTLEKEETILAAANILKGGRGKNRLETNYFLKEVSEGQLLCEELSNAPA